jgi:uncharacterized linocin/CFP29 family protein
MDILKRSLAPLTDKAWAALQDQARRSLRNNLSARAVADVIGPKGLDFAAVGLGRLAVAPCGPAEDKMCYGIHRVLPLVEARASFELSVWSFDDVERGARDLDFAPLDAAARRIAGFEEKAVYDGFEPGGIAGLARGGENASLPLAADAAKFPDTVVRAILVLKDKQVEGPYALVLGPRPFQALQGSDAAYPPRKQVEQLLGGPIALSPFIEGGFLVSTRGGDLELTLGQDLSLGYETHDSKTVRLYLSESFTFRVLDPTAFVELKLQN